MPHTIQGRGLGWKPDVPDMNDYRYSVSRTGDQVPAQIPPYAVAKNFKALPITDQRQTSACTGHSSSRHWAAELNLSPTNPLSPLFPYYWGRYLENDTAQDGGAEIRDVFKGIAQYGVAHAHYWPDVDKNVLRQPTKTADKDAHKHLPIEYHRLGASGDPAQIRQDILSCIASGHGFVTGVSCYDSMFTPAVDQSGLVPNPQPGEKNQGGHALSFGEYWLNHSFANTPYGQRCTQLGLQIPEEVVCCANSWSTRYGYQGYYFFDMKFLCNRDLCDDTWTARAK